MMPEHLDWISIASAGVGIGGLGCLWRGLKYYRPQIRFIQQTPLLSLEQVSQSLSVSNNKTVFAKVIGRVDGERFITSPMSKKHVVMFKQRHLLSPSVQTESTPFFISETNSSLKASVDPRGATLHLEKTAEYFTSVEYSLEASSLLFLMGECSFQSNGQMQIRKSIDSELPFIVSVLEEDKIIKGLKVFEYGWIIAGSVLVLGSFAHFFFFGNKAFVPLWLEHFTSSLHPF